MGLSHRRRKTFLEALEHRHMLASQTVEFTSATFTVDEGGSPIGQAVTLRRPDDDGTTRARIGFSPVTAKEDDDFLADRYGNVVVTFSPGESTKDDRIG